MRAKKDHKGGSEVGGNDLRTSFLPSCFLRLLLFLISETKKASFSPRNLWWERRVRKPAAEAVVKKKGGKKGDLTSSPFLPRRRLHFLMMAARAYAREDFEVTAAAAKEKGEAGRDTETWV